MDALVDLRSDTVTRPSQGMRRAMAEALVGDDVYGEDPTVNELESRVAGLLGKEAGLFMPSGTMANQVAILTHTNRGDEIFMHRDSHVFYYEGGAPSLWASAVMTLLDGPEGSFSVEDLQAHIRPENIHHPRPRMISLENTHNRAGGAALAPERLDPVMEEAHRQGLLVHLDGARIFNAAVALGVPASRLAKHTDSVSVCLSKGLGAPVGSVLVGPTDWIQQARRYRKWLGGGLRQVGVLAAAGLVALDNIARLQDDHRRAAALVSGLQELGYNAWVPSVPTNMVMVDLSVPGQPLVDQAADRGILMSTMGRERIRLVTHLDVDDEGVALALQVFEDMRGSLHGA